MPEYEEITLAERLRLMGEEVSAENESFYAAWATFNRSVGLLEGVSVVDKKEISLMRAFWNAGREYERGLGIPQP